MTFSWKWASITALVTVAQALLWFFLLEDTFLRNSFAIITSMVIGFVFTHKIAQVK